MQNIVESEVLLQLFICLTAVDRLRAVTFHTAAQNKLRWNSQNEINPQKI